MSDYLPQELLIKILIRLPPKSLIKFRCVSKSWNSLISNSYFISMQVQQARSTPNHIIIRCYSKAQNSEIYTVHFENGEFLEEKSIKIEYPFRDCTRFYYRIVGSCNGVICLSDDLFGQADDSVILWNPVIKRKVNLPVPQATFDCIGAYMFALGFGFDVGNNDYKVVRIAYAQGHNGYLEPPIVEVYTLSTRNWHTINGEVPKNCVVEYFWSQACIGGNVHWVAYRKDTKVKNLIMLFNIGLEVFDEMPVPNPLEKDLPINLNALVFEGSLAIVQYDDRVWSKSCCIWIMKEYGDMDSWSKQYKFDIEGGGLGKILRLRRNGDILLTARNRGLVSYNPITGASMDLKISGTKESFYIGTYIESLAFLDEGKEARERLSSDSDSEYESSGEDDEEDEDEDDDRFGDVEKSEFWMQCSMSQYLTVLLEH